MAKISYKKMKQMLRIDRYKEIAKYNEVIELGIDAMWGKLCSKVGDEYDPTDIFSNEEELKNLEYSMKLMNICCLSETWEQDLYNFLKEKGLVERNSNIYKNTERTFERAYPSCAISNYPLIDEMRTLVNAIKHGEGNALNNIRAMTGDSILADSNIGIVDKSGNIVKKKQIEFDNNTLTSRTLKVDGKLEIYKDELVRFWQDVFNVDEETLDDSSSVEHI